MRVLDELLVQRDELAEWARHVRGADFFVEGNREVQAMVGVINDFVEANYSNSEKKARFLRGADAWVIAHAKVAGGQVVTREAPVGENSTWVKIPNICGHFDVPWTGPFEMLRALGARLVREYTLAE